MEHSKRRGNTFKIKLKGERGEPGPSLPVPICNTAYLDPDNGNDITAVLETLNFPFKTYASAISAILAFTTPTADDQWQVYLAPCTLAENILLQPAINIEGINREGSVISGTVTSNLVNLGDICNLTNLTITNSFTDDGALITQGPGFLGTVRLSLVTLNGSFAFGSSGIVGQKSFVQPSGTNFRGGSLVMDNSRIVTQVGFLLDSPAIDFAVVRLEGSQVVNHDLRNNQIVAQFQNILRPRDVIRFLRNGSKTGNSQATLQSNIIRYIFSVDPLQEPQGLVMLYDAVKASGKTSHNKDTLGVQLNNISSATVEKNIKTQVIPGQMATGFYIAAASQGDPTLPPVKSVTQSCLINFLGSDVAINNFPKNHGLVGNDVVVPANMAQVNIPAPAWGIPANEPVPQPGYNLDDTQPDTFPERYTIASTDSFASSAKVVNVHSTSTTQGVIFTSAETLNDRRVFMGTGTSTTNVQTHNKHTTLLTPGIIMTPPFSQINMPQSTDTINGTLSGPSSKFNLWYKLPDDGISLVIAPNDPTTGAPDSTFYALCSEVGSDEQGVPAFYTSPGFLNKDYLGVDIGLSTSTPFLSGVHQHQLVTTQQSSSSMVNSLKQVTTTNKWLLNYRNAGRFSRITAGNFNFPRSAGKNWARITAWGPGGNGGRGDGISRGGGGGGSGGIMELGVFSLSVPTQTGTGPVVIMQIDSISGTVGSQTSNGAIPTTINLNAGTSTLYQITILAGGNGDIGGIGIGGTGGPKPTISQSSIVLLSPVNPPSLLKGADGGNSGIQPLPLAPTILGACGKGGSSNGLMTSGGGGGGGYNGTKANGGSGGISSILNSINGSNGGHGAGGGGGSVSDGVFGIGGDGGVIVGFYLNQPSDSSYP